MKKKYLNKQFLTYYAFVFVFLYIFFSLIRFLGQLPILLIITFFVTYYITYNSENSTIYENKSLLNLSSYFTPSNESNNSSSKGIGAGTSAGIGTRSMASSEPEIIIGNNSVSNKSSLGYRSFS